MIRERPPDHSAASARRIFGVERSWFAFIIWAATLAAPADVLVGLNGERLVGRVIPENSEQIVFESELAGRVTVPRARLVEVQRSVPPAPPAPPEPAKPVAIAPPTPGTNTLWRPPGVGRDGKDWIQLKSGEWLRGRLQYFRDNKVSFDSDELDEQTFDEEDVPQIFTGRPMFVKPEGKHPVYGTIAVTNAVVSVSGTEPLTLRRDEITGITPGGDKEISFWSGTANVGVNFQSGNTHQTTFNSSAELARRSPSSTLLLNYVGNIGEVNGTETANNHRVNGTFDIHLNRRLFVRTPYLEYYHDPLANVDFKGIAAVGVGYRIFDRDKLEWLVAAGPGYQYTRFETVEADHSDHNATFAGVLQSSFKAEITRRLDFLVTYVGTVSSPESGLYSHHAVSTLEFEIKKHLDLNVSFIWDYLQEPQTEVTGKVPLSNDYRLIVGLGVKF